MTRAWRGSDFIVELEFTVLSIPEIFILLKTLLFRSRLQDEELSAPSLTVRISLNIACHMIRTRIVVIKGAYFEFKRLKRQLVQLLHSDLSLPHRILIKLPDLKLPQILTNLPHTHHIILISKIHFTHSTKIRSPKTPQILLIPEVHFSH